MIYLVMDAPGTHGVSIGEDRAVEVSPKVQLLLRKYNATMVALPHNTSAALSPLDVTMFRTIKSYFGMILKAIPSVS